MFGDVRSKGIMHRRQTGRGYKELQDVYNLLITAPFSTLKQRFAVLLSRTLGIFFFFFFCNPSFGLLCGCSITEKQTDAPSRQNST